MGIRLNMANVVEGGNAVPIGTYHAFVTDCEVKYGADSGEPYVKFEFRVDGGKHDGRKIYHNCSLQEQSMPMTKPVLRALGCDVDNPEGIDFEPTEMTGRECVIKVIHKDYNGEKQASVRKVFSMDEGVEPDNGEGSESNAKKAPTKMFKGAKEGAGEGAAASSAKKNVSMFKKPKGE